MKDRKPKITRVIGDDGDAVFTVKSGELGLQFNKDEALYVAQVLAMLCGQRVEFRDANINSTKDKPLGF